MFQELQKKAKAVLRKSNPTSNSNLTTNPTINTNITTTDTNPTSNTTTNINSIIESSALRRRHSDYDSTSTKLTQAEDISAVDVTADKLQLSSSPEENLKTLERDKNLLTKLETISNTTISPTKNITSNINSTPNKNTPNKNTPNKNTPNKPSSLRKNPKKEVNYNREEYNREEYNRDNKQSTYALNHIKNFIKDEIFLKEQHVYIGGSIYLLVIQLFSLFLLSASDVAFVNGVLSGIFVLILVLIFYFLSTYSHAYEIHEYCFDLRKYILEELRRSLPKRIDFAHIPSTGIVQKNLHTYRGWVYLANEYDSSKILADQNPCIAFVSFGKHSLSIYIVAIITTESKRPRTNNFNVVKHYRLNYSGVEFEIIPETLSRKKYWSKKFPIKLTYSLGTLVSKRLNPFEPSYEKILAKMDDNNPCGHLPIPNQKFNNVTIDFDYGGGDIYLFALTGREKERWYRSLRLCIAGGPSVRSRTFKDIVEFSTVSVDPFSMKIDFINKIKDVLAHYKDINNTVISSTMKNISPSSQLNLNKKQFLSSKDISTNYDTKSKTLRNNKSNVCIQMNDEALMDNNVDKSLPLSYTTNSSQQMMVNCDSNQNTNVTNVSSTNMSSNFLNTNNTIGSNVSNNFTSNNNDGNKKDQRNEKSFPPNDNMLTLDYILSSKTTLAFNLLAYRLTWDVWREDRWTTVIKTKIQTKINSLKLPPFIKSLTIDQLDLGDQLPVVCSNCDPVLDSDGGVWLNLPLVYNGKLSFTFNAQLDVSIYDRLISAAAKVNVEDHVDITVSSPPPTINRSDVNFKDASSVKDNVSMDDPNLVNFHKDLQEDNASIKISKSSHQLFHKVDVMSDDEDFIEGTQPNALFSNEAEVEGTQSNALFSNEADGASDDEDDKFRYTSGSVSGGKMNQLLNSRSGKKLFNVVEKLAQSPFVKKLGRTEIAQKMYKAAKNKLSNLNVILTVNVTSLKGTLVLYIPPPPSDRLWFGFRAQPAMSLQVSTKLNTKNIKLPALIQFIDSKIKSEFKDVLVLPNMEDIYIPLMSTDIDYSD